MAGHWVVYWAVQLASSSAGWSVAWKAYKMAAQLVDETV